MQMCYKGELMIPIQMRGQDFQRSERLSSRSSTLYSIKLSRPCRMQLTLRRKIDKGLLTPKDLFACRRTENVFESAMLPVTGVDALGRKAKALLVSVLWYALVTHLFLATSMISERKLLSADHSGKQKNRT